jgi:hypothetical protein
MTHAEGLDEKQLADEVGAAYHSGLNTLAFRPPAILSRRLGAHITN